MPETVVLRCPKCASVDVRMYESGRSKWGRCFACGHEAGQHKFRPAAPLTAFDPQLAAKLYDDAKTEIKRLREALTTALLYIEFEPIRAELQAVLDKESDHAQ